MNVSCLSSGSLVLIWSEGRKWCLSGSSCFCFVYLLFCVLCISGRVHCTTYFTRTSNYLYWNFCVCDKAVSSTVLPILVLFIEFLLLLLSLFTILSCIDCVWFAVPLWWFVFFWLMCIIQSTYLKSLLYVCIYTYMLCVWTESVGLICVQFYMWEAV